ncbi:MAG: ABC transporter substrate-binding protein [Alphaproteobacteria bacterium]|nr:ABC transporter substrate-binding protein [Alphaproteobacteria bacterium]
MLTRRSLFTATASGPILWYAAVDAALADTPRDILVMVRHIGDVISFDPAEAYEFTANEIIGNCYRKLISPDPDDTSRIVGDLAESWSISPDGLTFTFRLRADAKFESGNTVTAHDAAFSLHRVVKLNKTPGFIITQFGFKRDNVESLIRAVDDRTLIVELPEKRASSFVLYCFSAAVGSIVERAAVLAKQVGEDLGNQWLKTNTAGAGPYKLLSWAASERITLVGNPHFPSPARMRRVVLTHVADSGAQLLILQKGDADVARDLGADQLRTVAANPDLHMVSHSQGTSCYIALNLAMPELAKAAVQQAVKWAIDYEGIAANITPNIWGVHQAFLPIGMPGAISDRPFRRDVARAKALMAEAGLAGGFAVDMDHYSVWPFPDIAQALQANLAEIGIRVTLVAGDGRQVLTKSRARNHQMALLRWSTDYFDPHSNAQFFCENGDDTDASPLKVMAWRCHFQDAELTAMARKGTLEGDTAKRLALYGAMQRAFFERGPMAFMLQRNEVAVLRRGVSGLKLGLMADYTKYGALEKG